ncbi:MAG: MATE family efflux transporter [Candidatus Ornithomonoglobus sp.]
MKNKTISMVEGVPIHLILRFAVPMLIGNMFQQLYNFVDSSIVGRYIGGDALAAVGATSQINSFLICVAMGITNGAGIIIAQCFGAKEYDRMKQSVTSMITALGVMVIVTTAAGIGFAYPALRLMNVPEEIIDTSVIYMRTIFAGCLPLLVYNTCSSILRNLGNSRVPLYMLIVSSCTNVVLDLVFVTVFNWGVLGAGIATVISQVISASLCLGYIVKNRREMNIDNLPKRAEKSMIWLIIKTGVPAALQGCCINLGGMCVQGLINSFGKAAMAAYTASTKIDSLTIQIIISLATSLSVFSGQNMGAGEIDRVKRGLRQSLCIMLPVCVILAILLLTFKRNVLALFLDPAVEGQAIEYGSRYLSVIGIGYIIAGIMQCHQHLLRGVGDVNICVIAGMTELCVRVAASFVFVKLFGLYGIWYAIPFSWGCACFIPVIRYYSDRWQTKRLVNV